MAKKAYLPLHVKTAMLASLVALLVMAAALVVVSASIARQIQTEQKDLATLGAQNLADELSTAQASLDPESLQNVANIISGSRPNLVAVRVWRFENGEFTEIAASDDSLPVEAFSSDIKTALQQGASSSSVRRLGSESDSYFRVLSPIVRGRQLSGAVEAVEKLDTISTLALRYAASLSWITLATVFFMAVAVYLLFQRLVYQPLGKLLEAMGRARSGDLSAAVPEGASEFGQLGAGFNSMMKTIGEMTKEREKRNKLLREEVKAATVELSEKNDQLENANLELFRATSKMAEMERLASAGQTAAEFAHEVGTPLNLISGHVQMLQAAAEPDSKSSERLQTITAQIERIERIVRQMLDRTRFGSGEHNSLDLNDLLRKTLAAIEPTLDEHKIGLSFSPSSVPANVIADADRLQQVFINLLKNAIDAMPAGGDLSIGTSVDGPNVNVEIADTGPGISDDLRERIFQPMFTTKERGRGTGLGLYVVRKILEEHGADISIQNGPSSGTIFLLRFAAA